MLDNETKQSILQKIWYRGQVLTPLYSMLCWIWFFRTNEYNHNRAILIYAASVLPIWCYITYRNVFSTNFSTRMIQFGGLLAEIAYIAVLLLSIQEIQTSYYYANDNFTNNSSRIYFVLMTIASGLSVIETFVFITVSTTIHQIQNESQYDDYVSLDSATKTISGYNITIHQISPSYTDTEYNDDDDDDDDNDESV